ncbi:protein containing DUF262 [gut metagenome]|uniref:Protein containing DUF262 n=1 Tax=gut metagenome TaxID=749906 RepID=J9F7P9_9ZZZZ
MEKILPLQERSIAQIYMDQRESLTYVIPIYQRNYAWEEEEISALVKDVHDSFRKNPHAPYYIGTLVTFHRGDRVYEVIDGQQRLTTLYILLKVLDVKGIYNKLTYGARKVSATTIEQLDQYPNLGDEVDGSIRNGYKFAKKAVESLVENNEYQAFESYFLHQVHIIHYQVPKDVDLNHYFEVMNSRGEQLEKHEIVKSLLGQYLKDRTELATFSRIWEACCEMNRYVQQTFPETQVFGPDLSKFIINGFESIPCQQEAEGKKSIRALLQQPLNTAKETDDKEQNDQFQPIIDFPNFLLVVLKLTRMEYDDFKPTDFILDDKELLNEFQNALNALKTVDERTAFSRKFAFHLLKAKYLLDNYIVHHVLNDKELTGDNPWKLQCYHQESSRKRYAKNLSDSPKIQDELVHVLSMFEVSFTPKQHKNYLFYCLMYLFEHPTTTADVYLKFLRSLADNYFFDVYLNEGRLSERNQPLPNAFDAALLTDGCLQVDAKRTKNTDYKETFYNIYKQGNSNISLFVFNYLDYRLWQKYAQTLRGIESKKGSPLRKTFFEVLGCSDFGLDAFDSFYFSRTRKSLEHFYPQAKAVPDEKASDCTISSTQINCLGNFAMISAEANSSGSNWDPKTKLDHYNDSKSNPVSVASLKFRIMMQICQDNQSLDRVKGMEWNAADMLQHQEKMLELLVHIF